MTKNLQDKLVAWIQLTRFDKPIGIELLLYPTLWSLFLASMTKNQLPSVKFVVIFALGAILMRASGCAINDFADRKVDGKVERTKSRPLADGRLSAKTAVATFCGLSLLSASLLLFLPVQVFYWSLVAVFLAFIYPFMKRYTHLPQVVLAAAFGWAVPMAYVCILGYVDVWGWLVFAAYMCWTVAYDTEYAMCDRNDDIKIGVKSTAILFGRFDVIIIMLLQSTFVMLMTVILYHYFANTKIDVIPVYSMFVVAAMMVKQYHQIKYKERLACFAAFLANAWVGRFVFLVIVVASFMANL
ncbi:MAG: 4-hydroxybenzoate octaprenyltransferase [Moraxella sp.]|nr:MAG: 4-hydroxybenzoate octaprenyltransferase [Moraxella sp.]